MAKTIKFGMAGPVPGESTGSLIDHTRKYEGGGSIRFGSRTMSFLWPKKLPPRYGA